MILQILQVQLNCSHILSKSLTKKKKFQKCFIQYIWEQVAEKFVWWCHICYWLLFSPMGSKHCNNDGRSVWTTRGTMLKKKKQLILMYSMTVSWSAYELFSQPSYIVWNKNLKYILCWVRILMAGDGKEQISSSTGCLTSISTCGMSSSSILLYSWKRGKIKEVAL